MSSLCWASLMIFACVVDGTGISSRAPSRANHTCSSSQGASCGNVLMQHTHRGAHVISRHQVSEDLCDEGSWPDKDHGLTCGDCKVLVNRFSSFYKTCNGYCAAVGRECVAAWEEQNDNCVVQYDMTCAQTIASSDAICQCGDQVQGGGGSHAENICYGELDEKIVNEGSDVGVPDGTRGSESACKDACNDNERCQSFTYCPGWGKCWLKDRRLSGEETTQTFFTCRTLFKRPCNEGSAHSSPPIVPSPPPNTPATGSSATIKVVSYNLYWWNAHDRNPWKFDHIANNIKNKLQADTLGLQECNDPEVIRTRAGYERASPFKGAQGVTVKPGLFTIGRTGFRDIRATGKWGPRYVTWTELTHRQSRRTFFHFNTHWCVHSGNGHTCSAGKRYTGARNMLDVIRQEAGSAAVVITGDFNAGMGEDGPQHFLRNGFTLAKSSWVDAIFYSSDHWTVKSTSKGDPAHSDHAPVIAVLELK